ncbi:MAG: isoprenylcysteine carboxylmethyltransferase family protein, partial [Gammaproteobacteria bacterium]|nr:isoprenylcysteine carboxylmethyltransferase family protein [Gammaproteobacteria bacterium]
DHGIYRISRNPMYVGLLFLLLAMATYLGNAYILLLVAFFIIYMNAFQIGPGERALEAIFDEDYRQYKARVRRWI